MVRSLASRPGGHTRMSRAHADAKATEAAAPEATEAATAAPRRIAGTPTHGYVLTREAAMVALDFADQRRIKIWGEARVPQLRLA